jgi:hypothetical protein
MLTALLTTASVVGLESHNTITVAALRRFDWAQALRDSGDAELQTHPEYWRSSGVPVKEMGKVWTATAQINALTVFGDWLYHCLPNGSDARTFLDYFVGVAMDSEDFLWSTQGVLPVGYSGALCPSCAARTPSPTNHRGLSTAMTGSTSQPRTPQQLIR